MCYLVEIHPLRPNAFFLYYMAETSNIYLCIKFYGKSLGRFSIKQQNMPFLPGVRVDPSAMLSLFCAGKYPYRQLYCQDKISVVLHWH